MREIWDSLPKNNVARLAKVVAVLPHIHSVDLVFLDDGTPARGVQVLSPFPASQLFGYSYLPAPAWPEAQPDWILKPGAQQNASGASSRAQNATPDVIKTARMLKGAPNGSDILPDTGVADVLQIKQGDVAYLPLTDFRLIEDTVSWEPGGDEPTTGTTYEVTYRYAKVVDTPTLQKTDTVIGSPSTPKGTGALTTKTIIMIRGEIPGGKDLLPDTGVVSLLKVKQGDVVYRGLTDYLLTANTVDWYPDGNEPAVGTQYTVEYQYESSGFASAAMQQGENSPEVQQTEARKWSPNMTKTRDIIAWVQYANGMPFVTGFLPPQIDALGFDAKAYPDIEVKRHSSGVHQVTLGDGASEYYDPTRKIRITVGEEGKDSRLALAGKDYHKKYPAGSGGKKGTLVVSADGDATVVRIKKCGVEIETLGAVTVRADCGVVVEGILYATDVIAGGVSLKNHKHGGVESGGSQTDKPTGGSPGPSCGCA